MATKAPQLIQHYVTSGDRSLRDWHLFLRRVTFGAALVLMSASVVSLHWACNLIGLRGWWEPVAWAVPLAMEAGMAAVASTATTIRKDPKPGREDHPGGYHISLWLIFSFVMLLAQASNIGHAVVTVAERANELPAVIPSAAVYVFAGAFAALFPLGGTLFVHVSGFLRAHGTGARWIEDDAEVVYQQVQPGTPTAQKPAPQRTPRAPQREASPAQRAPQVDAPARTAAPAQQPTVPSAPAARTTSRAKDEVVEAAYQAYAKARDEGSELDGNDLAALLDCHPGNARNTRNKKFRPRYEAERSAATPAPTDEVRAADPVKDPIVAQVEADQQKAETDAEDAKVRVLHRA